MNRRRWDILAKIIKDNGYTKIAEIGVKSGRNMERIIKQCRGQITEFHCVDPWCETEDYKHWTSDMIKRHEREFDQAAKNFPESIKYKMFSHQAVDYFEDGSLDLVFIDGDHSYEGCKLDIECWLPKVRKGGIISGHDYKNFPHPRHGDKFVGVTVAVDEAFSADQIQEFNDHVWVVRVC